MKNHEMVKFDFNGNNVRIVLIEGKEHWLAKDVCEALDISDASSAIRGLDDDERVRFVVMEADPQDLRNGAIPRTYIAVSEAGLYKLILRSHKPRAKEFTRWVTHDVLPKIRVTGFWSAGDEAQLANPSQLDLERTTGIISRSVAEGMSVGFSGLIEQMKLRDQILLEGMQQVISRNLQEHVEATHVTQQVIGSGGSWHIRERIKTIAEIRFPDDPKMQKAERSAMQLNLRSNVQFFGTGRSWNHLPQDKWQQALNWLEEQYRSAARGAKAAGREPAPDKRTAMQLAFGWGEPSIPKGN